MATKGRRRSSAGLTPEILEYMKRSGQEHLLVNKATPRPEASPAPVSTPEAPKPSAKAARVKKLTTPEREMSAMLAIQKARGEIEHYGFEEVGLSIGDPRCRFHPDFFVVLNGGKIRFVETKGMYVREDAIVKFKVARKQYPWFEFQMWQRTEDGQWQEIYKPTNENHH